MCLWRLSRVKWEKKILSSHTTTNPPSQTCNIGKVLFRFHIGGCWQTIEAKANVANVTDKAYEAFEADKAEAN